MTAPHSRRTFFVLAAIGAGAAALGGALLYEPILRDSGSVPALPTSRFHTIYSDAALRRRFLAFLRTVFHIVPPDTLDAVIAEGCRLHATDRAIYLYIQERLPEVIPPLSTVRYALPALRTQKAEMARETARLVQDRGRIERYVEIGTPGRYVGALREHIGFGDEVYLVHDREPGFGPVDVVERGQLGRAGSYLALDDYAPITRNTIPKGRIDLVTNYIGLHHAPRPKFDAFVASIHEAIRPGGTFVLRDHDVRSATDDTFVALAHDVFNAGIEAHWTTNAHELRFFLPLEETCVRVERHGFRRLGPRLAQPGDPTKNLLVSFERL
jgi:hypothetical protein